MKPQTHVQHSPRGDLAITFSGGGARAAYQVGVLRGLARHVTGLRPVILTGESAGEINVACMAAHPGPLPQAIDELWPASGASSRSIRFSVLVPFPSGETFCVGELG